MTEAQRTSLKGRFPYSTYRPSKKEDTTRFMSRWLQRMRRRFVPSQSMPEVDLYGQAGLFSAVHAANESM